MALAVVAATLATASYLPSASSSTNVKLVAERSGPAPRTLYCLAVGAGSATVVSAE